MAQDTEFDQLTKIGSQRNPAQESRYQQLKSQGATSYVDSGATSPTGGLDTTSILKNAQQMQDFYKQQNQPAIQSQQASIAPLQQRYSDLLSSIKQNQGIAENRQTVTTQNELGRRGIVTESGVGQQELTNALNPITSQYTQMGRDTTNQENIDLANINNAIAALQTGNPTAAMSGATGLAQAQQQAQQFEQSLAQQQQQQAVENALKQLIQQQNYQQQQEQLGISKQNAGIAGGHLALDQAQFELQKQLQDPAYIQKILSAVNIGNTQTINPNIPGLSSFIH